ncbi:hypothetical protein ScPMuIL_018201 [Solemya velum]
MMNNSRRNKVISHGTALENKKVKSSKSTEQIHQDSLDLAGSKRLGDNLLDPNQKRRAAFGDITNALNEKKSQKIVLKKSNFSNRPVIVIKPKEVKQKTTNLTTQIDTQLDDSENEIDETLLILSQGVSSSQDSDSSAESERNRKNIEHVELILSPEEQETVTVPEDVDDVDKENLHDLAQVANYAADIFRYYKEREVTFKVCDYMSSQPQLTGNMRAILVDWLVEVQENFELNHETLYLAVKLVDTYLSKTPIPKESLQLLGAAALFVSCKFDERCPPLVEDFLYICDDAYKTREFLAMERSILKTVGFDLGMPLSYRFLRRYAKCSRSTIETLTLARYILEMSLMEYDLVSESESKMAAASLLLAFRMKECSEWTRTLEYHTGYKSEDLESLLSYLNKSITAPPKHLKTIKSKYSHKVFYEVAKVSPLTSHDF